MKSPAREKRADRIDYKKLAEGEGRHIKTEELIAEPRTTVEKAKEQKNVEPVELRRSTRERKAPKRYE